MSDGDDKKESVFHDRPITDGTYGELSKIQEELDEAYDADERGIDLLVLIELSDILGAVAGVAEQEFGFTLDQLIPFAELVRDVKSQENRQEKIDKVKTVILETYMEDPGKAEEIARRATKRLNVDFEPYFNQIEELQKGEREWEFANESYDDAQEDRENRHLSELVKHQDSLSSEEKVEESEDIENDRDSDSGIEEGSDDDTSKVSEGVSNKSAAEVVSEGRPDLNEFMSDKDLEDKDQE